MENPQQPQAPVYPYFPMSDDGLKKIHQELGRLMHIAFEREVGLLNANAAYQQLAAASGQMAEQHAPGKCAPVEDAPAVDAPTPIGAKKSAG